MVNSGIRFAHAIYNKCVNGRALLVVHSV